MAKTRNAKEFKEKWIEDYKKGMSLTAIGKLYGFNKNTIKNQIKDDVVFREKSPNEKYMSEWLELYNKGYSKAAIGRQYSVSSSVVGRILEKAGVPLDNEHLLLHKDKEEKMIELYLSGKTLKEVSEEVGVSGTTVWKYLERAKVDRRWYTETSRIYNFDENYFDEMDETKSFILGTMYKVSFVYNAAHGNILKISLSIKKKPIITKIHEELKLEREPYIDETDRCYRIDIHSAHICETLKELGIRQISGEFTEPKLSADNYKRFIEGYIYANCTIKDNEVCISTCSDFIKKDVIKYLKDNLNINNIHDKLENKIIMRESSDIILLNNYVINIEHKYYNNHR